MEAFYSRHEIVLVSIGNEREASACDREPWRVWRFERDFGRIKIRVLLVRVAPDNVCANVLAAESRGLFRVNLFCLLHVIGHD